MRQQFIQLTMKSFYLYLSVIKSMSVLEEGDLILLVKLSTVHIYFVLES